MMLLLLYLGLFFALTLSPLSLAYFKRLHIDQLSLAPRISLWVVAAIELVIAAIGIDTWRRLIGLVWPTWQMLGMAVIAAAALFFIFGVYQHFLDKCKFFDVSQKQLELQKTLFEMPLWRRLFVVTTAAFTEEILYRGYAIGIGQYLLGSVWLACILSIVAFMLAHLAWGLAHLIPIFLATFAITLTFVLTQNLWACIIVHGILDGVGLLIGPVVMARKNRTLVKD